VWQVARTSLLTVRTNNTPKVRFSATLGEEPDLIPDVLPAREVPINIQPGEDATRIKVGDVGGLMVAPLRDEEGNLTTLRHAPIRFVEDTVLARGTGSSWRDPEMRQWESGGHAEQGDFNWSG
jgi:hypothetical protein